MRGSGEGWRSPRWLALPGALVAGGHLAALLWLIWQRTPHAPYWDEWELVNFLQLAHLGRLTFATFWAFQNEHRIVLPRLLLYALIRMTGWDRQVIMTANLALASLTTALIAGALRRALGPATTAIILAPLALLLCSFAQFENWLFAFQLNFLLAAFGLALCLRALAGPPAAGRREAWRVLVALLGAAVASLSTLAGLLTWPAFLPAVLRRGRRAALLWCGAALAIGVPYFIGFPGATVARGSPGAMAAYTLAYLGAPLGYPSAPLAAAWGVPGLLALAGSVLACRRRGVPLALLLPWLGLAAFAAASAALTAYGRAAFGLDQALTSRYQLFAAPFWLGLLVTALRAWFAPDARSPRRAALAGGALAGVLLIAGLVRADLAGYRAAAAQYAGLRRDEWCVRDYPDAPDDCLLRFYPDAPTARAYSAYLEQRRLTLFRDDPGTPDFRHLPATAATQGTIDTLGDLRASNAALAVPAGRPLTVRGWAADRAAAAPAGRVYLVVDGRWHYRADSGIARPDVAAATGTPAYARAGFVATVPQALLPRGPHTLALLILSADSAAYAPGEQSIAFEVR